MRKRVARLLPGHSRVQADDNAVVRGIFLAGSVMATLGQARRIKRQVDRIISRTDAERAVTSLRKTLSEVKSLKIARLVEMYSKQAKEKRTSGFVSIKKAGYRRGDGSEMAKLTLIDWVAKPKKLVKKDEKNS